MKIRANIVLPYYYICCAHIYIYYCHHMIASLCIIAIFRFCLYICSQFLYICLLLSTKLLYCIRYWISLSNWTFYYIALQIHIYIYRIVLTNMCLGSMPQSTMTSSTCICEWIRMNRAVWVMLFLVHFAGRCSHFTHMSCCFNNSYETWRTF